MLITKTIDFCVGHRLLNYEGACKNMHGHNIKLEVSFRAMYGLNASGMIIDFSKIKDSISQKVKHLFDHGFLVNSFDEETIKFLSANGHKYFVMPIIAAKQELYDDGQMVAFSNPTMENFSKVLARICVDFGESEDVYFDHLKLYESDTGWITITYNDIYKIL